MAAVNACFYARLSCLHWQTPAAYSTFQANASEVTLRRYTDLFIIIIIVKKLNSLKHLVRTTVAESHN